MCYNVHKHAVTAQKRSNDGHLDPSKLSGYYYFICHPTTAGDSTNILPNFTIHDANAIDIHIHPA